MREFTMPDDADDTKVDAKYEDGVLDITIAKAKTKHAKSKEIRVE